MTELDRLKSVIKRSSDLSKQGQDEKALALLDDFLLKDVPENRAMWIRIVFHHAAVISDSMGDVQRVINYYEQSLAANPNNSRAMYGLAKALQRQGEPEQAKKRASECHRSIQHTENELDRALLELLVDGWPEFAKLER